MGIAVQAGCDFNLFESRIYFGGLAPSLYSACEAECQFYILTTRCLC